MQFPTFSKNDSASEASGSSRIEPTIGESKPAPWDVTPESAPAFEMVSDSAEEPRIQDETPPSLTGFEKRQDPPAGCCEPSPHLSESGESGMETSFSLPSSETVSHGVQPLTEEVSAPVTETAVTRKPTEEKKAPSASDSPKKENGFFSFLRRGGPAPRPRRPDEEHDVPTEEQLIAREKTRHRLVGAATLLMGLVVVSSFLLDSETLVKNEAEISTAIPPVPEAPAVSAVVPMSPDSSVSAPTVQEVTKVEAPKVADASKNVAPVTADPPKKVQPVKEIKTEKKPPVKETAAKTGAGYFIQLVVTSSEQKAEKMVRDLKRLKLPAYQERIQGKKGPLWRVRIGHFKTEKEAKNTVAVLALNGYTGNHYIDKQ